MTTEQIRDWLEDHLINRHLTIEYMAIEVSLFTYYGLAGMVSTQYGEESFVFWDNETPKERALRELHNEGFFLTKGDLKFVGVKDSSLMGLMDDSAVFKVVKFVTYVDDSATAYAERSMVAYPAEVILESIAIVERKPLVFASA